MFVTMLFVTVCIENALLASVFTLYITTTSYFWGWLADAYKKKTILMYSGICVALSSLIFGFSVNFYMAVIFRFIGGLSNGTA